ncbi:hypothetical protein [Ruania albidiflava]|uniref:arsenate reductase/protein-tyrosine-phosphatase family protein n=1 Tax=Ruania albidiflava TaxID=366586 RepID=UPI00146B9ED3|nr:hypothetical protein [Ruania albidiflava]
MRALRGGVLVLCEANVCRSVLAEYVIRSTFASHPLLESMPVKSAGVRAREGLRACTLVSRAHADRQWRRWADAHRAHAVQVEEIAEANLVLTAARDVRSEAVALVPSSRRRIFTLPEALWLGSGVQLRPHGDGFAAIDALVSELDGQRGLWPMNAGAGRRPFRRRNVNPLDIPDGHNAWRSVHKRTIHAVEQSAQQLAALVVASVDETKR